MLTAHEKYKADPVGITIKLAILTDGQRVHLFESLLKYVGDKWTLSESFLKRLISHPDSAQIKALPHNVRSFIWQTCSNLLSGTLQATDNPSLTRSKS